jgi:hypothetical protein
MADANLPASLGVSAIPVSDEQAKAIGALSNFGVTIVTETSGLARYMGRVLGTAPHDAVGLVIGDPLHFVREAIAAQYDVLLDKILNRRNVKHTQPVTPSLAIPLFRGAYDEGRPELQELWAALMASAMDPTRAGRVRLSFIETLRRFDPLDALVLQKRYEHQGDVKPNPVAGIASMLGEQGTEVQISVDNLTVLKCVGKLNSEANFYITNYGQSLVRVCAG